MSNVDKRKVSTDALETLGKIIGDDEKRDAIHLGVEPVIAGEELNAGDHIGIENGKAYANNRFECLGIVDPFLGDSVKPGQRFWLIIYPRKITSLRHVWTHPDLEDSDASPVIDDSLSIKWMMDYAASLEENYDELLDAADAYISFGVHLNKGEKFEGECVPKEFWDHYEKIKKLTVTEDDRGDFFSCSC